MGALKPAQLWLTMERKVIMGAQFFSGSSPVVLVAGGAGFIGSYLCQKLLDKSVKVVCLDNWLTGVRENIAELKSDPNFYFLEHDVTHPIPASIARCDYIVHLAGVEAYLNGEDVSIETLEANSLGTKNLLDLAREKKARFLLVSTIHVYSAKISAAKLASYFGEGRAFEGEFSHHEAKRFAEALTSEYAQKAGLDARIVRVADVYGPRMMLVSGNFISRLIKEALYGGPLKVPGGEEKTFFPAYINDVVEGIQKALFSAGTRGKIIALVGPRTSAFAMATAVKNVVVKNAELAAKISELSIEFTGEELPKKETSDEILASGQELISWKPRTLLEEGLAKTLLWFLEHKTRIPQEKEEKKETLAGGFWANFKVKQQFAKKITGATAALLLLLFLFLPFWLPFLEIGTGVLGLTLAKNALETANVDQASFWAKGAGVFLGEARAGFDFWGNLPGLSKKSRELASKSNSLVRVAQMAQNLARAGQAARVLLGGVFGEEPFDASESARKLSLELGVLERELGFLEAELGSRDVVIDFPLLPPFRASQNFDFAAARRATGALVGVLPSLGELLGEAGPKTYLVLFQNNMELRPTGGFIGSFALVTFENGRFTSLEIQDVYSADGQLRGHVEPPKAIREHLGEASWFLRDSNWSPDFPTSARRAAWFIDKELGKEVGGVLAIDLELVRELTRLYGPLQIDDFGETVTADNLYEKTQAAAEGEFFPGSRAKKDFLTALSRGLLEKVLAKDKKGKLSVEKLIPAAKALFLAFENRHAAVWLDTPEVTQALALSGWDGRVSEVFCQSQGCQTDYLLITEANLGVNKSNYFLDRSYALDFSVKESGFSHQLTISYKNRSQSGVWPGGDYKNYARLFVPATAKLHLARLINPETGEQDELAVDEETETKDKKSFGILANVPAGTLRQLTLVWETPRAAETNELVFLWQKQLGVPADPVWAHFAVAEGSKFVLAQPIPTLISSTSADYNTEFARDLIFNLRWQNNP